MKRMENGVVAPRCSLLAQTDMLPACRILDVSWSPAARSEIQPAASDDITYGRLLGPTISLTTGDVASNLGRHFTTTKGQLSSKDYKSTLRPLSHFRLLSTRGGFENDKPVPFSI